MDTSLPFTIPCLAPGLIGTVYDNGFAPTEVSLSAIATISIAIETEIYPDVAPALHTPAVTSRVAPVFSGFGVTGTLTGQIGAIHAILIDAYPRDANGLVLDWLFASRLDTLFPGATHMFTTLETESSFTQYRLFIDFLDGVRLPGLRALSASTDPMVVRELARREHRDATRSRAEQAARQ